MYRWLLLLHFVGIFVFLLAHGVSVAVTFQLRRERDPVRIGTLLAFSRSSLTASNAGLVLLLAAGVALGFTPGLPGTWWEAGWIWGALALLVAVSVAMLVLARPYYRRLERVANARAGGSTAVTDEDLVRVLMASRPLVIAAMGFGALLIILWLMVLKPF